MTFRRIEMNMTWHVCDGCPSVSPPRNRSCACGMIGLQRSRALLSSITVHRARCYAVHPRHSRFIRSIVQATVTAAARKTARLLPFQWQHSDRIFLAEPGQAIAECLAMHRWNSLSGSRGIFARKHLPSRSANCSIPGSPAASSCQHVHLPC